MIDYFTLNTMANMEERISSLERQVRTLNALVSSFATIWTPESKRSNFYWDKTTNSFKTINDAITQQNTLTWNKKTWTFWKTNQTILTLANDKIDLATNSVNDNTFLQNIASDQIYIPLSSWYNINANFTFDILEIRQ